MRGRMGNSSSVIVLAMLGVAALAAAFWMLALQPKREEAAKLGEEIEQVESSLARHKAEVVEAEEAKREFPAEYRKLVVLGKAVPDDDDTASLLVQLNGIAKGAGVRFNNFSLNAEGGGEGAPPPAPEAEGPDAESAPAAAPISPTEAVAAVLPLGATIGPAGLAVMPYSLNFSGDFFALADFIKGLDSLVKTDAERVAVDGRLLTINGFSLGAGPAGFPSLEGSFSVTTYLTPPTEGIAGGATPQSPGGSEATPAATKLGGAP